MKRPTIDNGIIERNNTVLFIRGLKNGQRLKELKQKDRKSIGYKVGYKSTMEQRIKSKVK
ncbi:hypothetical protein BpHYR1_009665 [Brachionus plicatilis]|uniref:Uncharacterized protein n=1 Tax=Brachionus plicatilis TaxID=10195 RepID=A0A3M7SRN4_BRAPC|nr:hypothetical protein BpHYR1_009665 [Brachionus plicatilis]